MFNLLQAKLETLGYSKRTIYLTLAILLIASTCGFIALVSYKDVPIVRNSLLYARILYNLDDFGREFASSTDAYNKPLGFAYLSLPFYYAFGANTGLKILSFVGTVLWIVSLIPFFHRLKDYWGIKSLHVPLFLIITICNPLVTYQFISAYPDIWYALSFLWSVYYLDRIFSKDIMWFDGIAFAFWALFSMWVKHNGFIIYPVLLVMFVYKYKFVAEQAKNDPQKKNAYWIMLAATTVISLIMLYAYSFETRWFNLGQNSGNFLGGESRIVIIGLNLIFIVAFFLLTTGFLTPLIRLVNFKQNKMWYTILAIFVASILFYHGTKYNVRYYITVLPFFSLMVLPTLLSLTKKHKQIIFSLFFATNIFLIFIYNTRWFYNLTDNYQSMLPFDNLRLNNEQLEAENDLLAINKAANEHNVDKLYFISFYYEDGAHYVWERENLLSDQISEVVYAKTWDDVEKQVKSETQSVLIFDEYKQARNKIEMTEITKKVYLVSK